MRIYHHKATGVGGNDSEAWTLILLAEEYKTIFPPLAFKEVYNPHYTEVRFFCENGQEAESFARNHGIQILEA